MLAALCSAVLLFIVCRTKAELIDPFSMQVVIVHLAPHLLQLLPSCTLAHQIGACRGGDHST